MKHQSIRLFRPVAAAGHLLLLFAVATIRKRQSKTRTAARYLNEIHTYHGAGKN
jgi:hypothetical protein